MTGDLTEEDLRNPRIWRRRAVQRIALRKISEVRTVEVTSIDKSFFRNHVR
ncbi:hypothetical protein [Labedaea rhizosphaerae]|uniref:Uncharacterized protein n=1 Tax=Labedaea rhizosphaerae TaxID=598644 RepID=A0A4R6SE06_LABRH|nr:hypothetical protein [Labedaea rhizosphaerae]TDP98122.1 hypothetical protein EV186_1031102 [Labedaea rhizosphaerae]